MPKRTSTRVRAAVVIAPSLRRQSPQNGNIRGRSRRLSEVGAPKSANWEPGDEIECAKSRYFRPFVAIFRNCSRALECLAGPAVVFPYFSLDRCGKSGVLFRNLKRAALSSAKTGVEFIAENGGGAGVRLKKRKR